MPVSIAGTGIKYGSPVYNPYGSESTPQQSRCSPIVKIRSTSASTINQTTGGASHTFVNGTEIDMGVPTKSTNWYRCCYQTIVDDNDGNYGGIGFSIWRYTPSSGWNRVLDNVRINCGIGNDLLRNGWINNIFEVWEIDGSGVHTSGLMTRY